MRLIIRDGWQLMWAQRSVVLFWRFSRWFTRPVRSKPNLRDHMRGQL